MQTGSSRKKFQKLVRDNIPQLIEKSGGTTRWHVVPREGRYQALIDKIKEEVDELETSCTAEEFLEEAADVYEVLMALVYERGFIDADLTLKANQKRRDKGGFDRFLWLDEVSQRDS